MHMRPAHNPFAGLPSKTVPVGFRKTDRRDHDVISNNMTGPNFAFILCSPKNCQTTLPYGSHHEINIIGYCLNLTVNNLIPSILYFAVDPLISQFHVRHPDAIAGLVFKVCEYLHILFC
jgi:hypothetical protein